METIAQASKFMFRQRALFSLSCGRRGLASLTRHPQPTEPFTVRPSEAEVRNKSLAPRNLELAVRSLHTDGLVVVENVVPHNDLDSLNEKMVKDARYLQSLGDKGPFNYNLGNLQQDPPPVAEYFYKSMFTSRSPFYLMVLEVKISVDHSNRPHRNPNHIDSPRAPSQMDLLLCELRHATTPRCLAPAAARPLGRRLCPSLAPVRAGRQYPSRGHDA